jgi:hypothetical protein
MSGLDNPNHEPLVEFRDVSFAINNGHSIIDRLDLEVTKADRWCRSATWRGKTTTLAPGEPVAVAHIRPGKVEGARQRTGTRSFAVAPVMYQEADFRTSR